MGILIRKAAPSFQAKAVLNNQIVDLSLEEYRGQYVLLFFYPLDFTFVCPTELHAFEEKTAQFEARNAQVIACSVDSQYAHYAWCQIPKEKGGIQGISYPIVSDLNKQIASSYGVLEAETGVAYRGLFLINREGIVCHQLINDLPLGRSVDEALRMLDALIFFEMHGEVCPANWQMGKQGMRATAAGVEHYFSHHFS